MKEIEVEENLTPSTPNTPEKNSEQEIKRKPDIEKLNKLMEETKRKVSNQEEVDIDVISVSDMPRITKNSNSIKQQLNDSQNYSMTSSRRQKKYSTFLLRN